MMMSIGLYNKNLQKWWFWSMEQEYSVVSTSYLTLRKLDENTLLLIAMRIGEKGPRIKDGKRGPDQTFQEARIGPHDWPGSDTKKVRIRSQRGAGIGHALRDAYKGFHFGLTKIPGKSSRP